MSGQWQHCLICRGADHHTRGHRAEHNYTPPTKEPDMTQPTTDEQVAALARDYRNLNNQKSLIEEQQDHIKERVRDLLQVGDSVVVDGTAVRVEPNRRFDPKRAVAELPPDLLEMCRVTKVDPAAARKVLPPALYEGLMSEVGSPRVVLA